MAFEAADGGAERIRTRIRRPIRQWQGGRAGFRMTVPMTKRLRLAAGLRVVIVAS